MMTRVTAAVGLVLGGLCYLSTPAATAEPCSDVEVVFARGTGEAPGLGATGQKLVDSLRSKAGPRSVGVYAVDYPASKDFANSIAQGAGDASAHVEQTAASCPNTRMVLGGFSQGASVIDTITGTLPPDIYDHVAAVAVFGNPRSAYAARQLGGVPLPVISPQYASKTIDQCLPEDGICGAGWWPFAHEMYPVSGMVEPAADFVAGRL